MREILNLNDIMQALSDTEKTASDTSASNPSSATDSDRSDLLATLQKAAETKQMAKTASAQPQQAAPIQDLEKIARSIADAEEEAIVKEAQLYGAAVCDGFMSRMNQYEKAAELVGANEKTASQGQVFVDDEGNEYSEYEVKLAAEMLQQEQGQTKIAQEALDNLEPQAIELARGFIKEAADQGYRLSDNDALEKVASVAFNQGYKDTMEKYAEEAYSIGFDETLEKCAEVLHEAGYTEAVNALTKTAFDQGYQDAMEKIAESAFAHGCNDMQNLLQAAASN